MDSLSATEPRHRIDPMVTRPSPTEGAIFNSFNPLTTRACGASLRQRNFSDRQPAPSFDVKLGPV